MLRRAVLIIGLVALAHAALYIVYQRGDWQSATAWTDQRGYQRLGASLATTGQFTRYADTDVFVPEVIRTPGYPAFVARGLQAVRRRQRPGRRDRAGVRVRGDLLDGVRASRGAPPAIAARSSPRLMTALFSPLPYFGSLILTELWTAFMATAAILVCLRAAQRGRLPRLRDRRRAVQRHHDGPAGLRADAVLLRDRRADPRPPATHRGRAEGWARARSSPRRSR